MRWRSASLHLKTVSDLRRLLALDNGGYSQGMAKRWVKHSMKVIEGMELNVSCECKGMQCPPIRVRDRSVLSPPQYPVFRNP